MILGHTISSSRASHDQQASDALDYLRLEHPAAYADLRREFPEALQWDGAWLDTAAMEVDIEWSSWLTDAIESTGWVQWHDGEPYAMVPDVVYSDGAIVDASDHHPDCLCDDCEAERED